MLADRPLLEDRTIREALLGAAFALKGGQELENDKVTMISRVNQYQIGYPSGATLMRIICRFLD